MFFTRSWWKLRNSLKDQNFRESYVVLYKIGHPRADQPNLCRGMLQVHSYVVLYKMVDAAPPIALALLLPVALRCLRMRLPVGLLIVGVLGSPLLAAVPDALCIHRIGLDLPPVVIGTTAPLALRLAANALLESVRRRLKGSLAIGAAAGRNQCGSSEVGKGINF